jgi:hypothetical protein
MKKRLIGALGAACLILALSTPAFAAGQNGQGNGQSPLVHNHATTCTAGGLPPSTPGTGNGFAVIRRGHRTVSAQVSLKNALPNTTYGAFLEQMPSLSGCFVTVPFTTNGHGNGHIHIKAALVPGTTAAWVSVLTPTISDFYNSTLRTFS